MSLRSKPHRIHLILAVAIASVVALACGWPAAHKDPPTEKVPFESVLGTWKGGRYTIEFHEDGSYTLTSDGGKFTPLREDGTWTLCKDYPYEEFVKEGAVVTDCVEATAGEWIQFHHPENRTIDFPWELIFTGDDEDLQLYAYNLDTGVDEDLLYRKVSEGVR